LHHDKSRSDPDRIDLGPARKAPEEPTLVTNQSWLCPVKPMLHSHPVQCAQTLLASVRR
jgi:hypothetical protein